MSSASRERYRLADLTVDVGASSVVRQGGEPLALPKLSFDLLVALLRRSPDVVSADELIATVWAGLAISDETLTQRVALLRKALGDEARSPRYLRSVRGRGYQLVPAAVTLGPDEEPSERVRHWRFPAAAAAALAALGVLTYLALARGHRAAAGAASTSAGQAQVASGAPRVAELLSRAGAYLRRHQQANNELAIELYERALRLEPDNPRALAGLSLALAQRATKFNRRGEDERAMALALQAVARDPRLGLAHHALGMALDSRGKITPALAAYLRAADLESEPANALASAAYLMQVQGRLADALQADLRAARAGGETPLYLEAQIGTTLALLGFDQAAEVWFERALELRPDNVFAPTSFARMRLAQGRIREADAIAARALERGIRRPELPEIRGTVAVMVGDETRARTLFGEALAIDPGSLRAQTRLLLLDRRHGGAADSALDRRYREEMQRLREDRDAGDEWPDSALDEALLGAGFGDPAAALRALDDAFARGYRDADWLTVDPMLAGARGDRLAARASRIRELVATERRRVSAAPWLPPGFLGTAAKD